MSDINKTIKDSPTNIQPGSAEAELRRYKAETPRTNSEDQAEKMQKYMEEQQRNKQQQRQQQDRGVE